MVIHYGGFFRKFFQFSFIGIIFLISCNQEKVEQNVDADATEWFTKLGFIDVMTEMREDTRSLTSKVKWEEWEDAQSIGNKISSSFNQLDLESEEIPDDFSALKEEFDAAMSKVLVACEEKDLTKAMVKLEVMKRSCRSCHLIYRKELDIFNKDFDHGVAMERMFKDRDKE
ncbi:MAG: hypothetical protein SCALA701_31050 [Candidatus Scalindua sp.]|nr:cytochrome c [Planctomycetota bacterium]GJQ60304.1 MAG: hypothetical protein SCALA701_31050 [Candidatus Scalindua sp.]